MHRGILHHSASCCRPAFLQTHGIEIDLPRQEMFELFGRAVDAEAEHIVPLLAKKAGEVSVGGRENFMATEADAALAAMVENLSETRVRLLKP